MILGRGLDQLGYYRLIPHGFQNVQFQWRKYTFRSSTPVMLCSDREENLYASMPLGEQIVLVNAEEWAVAILMPRGYHRGIYHAVGKHFRSKVNIHLHSAEVMHTNEISRCPVGRQRSIIGIFAQERTGYNSLERSF